MGGYGRQTSGHWNGSPLTGKDEHVLRKTTIAPHLRHWADKHFIVEVWIFNQTIEISYLSPIIIITIVHKLILKYNIVLNYTEQR